MTDAEKIKEVLDRHLNNYWNSVTDSTKKTIAQEIVDFLNEKDPTCQCGRKKEDDHLEMCFDCWKEIRLMK